MRVHISTLYSIFCLLILTCCAHAGGVEDQAASREVTSCNNISDHSVLSLADYTDWVLATSGESKAHWKITPDESDPMPSLEVSFSMKPDRGGRSNVVMSSPSLSALQFDSISGISGSLKSSANGRLRIILRDSIGRQFYSRKPADAGFPDWVDFPSMSYASDSVVFHNMSVSQDHLEKFPSLIPPFSIDHIQLTLIDKTVDGSIKFADLIVSGNRSGATGTQKSSPYSRWFRSTCVLRAIDTPQVFLGMDEQSEPIDVGQRMLYRVTVEGAESTGNALLEVLYNRFGAQPVIKERHQIDFSEEKSSVIEMHQRFNAPGLYSLTARLTDSVGRLLSQDSRKIMVWDPPGNSQQDSVPEFFGMMYLDRFPETRSSDLNLMRKAGVRIVRFPFRWSEIEPTQNEFRWGTYDGVMRDLDTLGFIAQPMVVYTPRWAARKELATPFTSIAAKRPQWVAPNAPDTLASFIGTAAARYRDQALVWEIWNEPTESQNWIGGTNKNYIDVLTSAAYQVRLNSNQAKVISAGIGISSAENDQLALAIADLPETVTDGYSIHAYGGEQQVKQNIAEAQHILADRSKYKGVWVNESGYLVDPSDPTGELRRSAALTKMAVTARFMEAQNFTWFIFKNFASSTKSSFDNYAIRDADNSIRASLLAYANVTRWLVGSSNVDIVNIGQDIQGYEFVQNDKRILVTWLRDELAEEFIAPPAIPGMSLEGVYDMFGGLVRREGQISQGHAPLFFVYSPKPV